MISEIEKFLLQVAFQKILQLSYIDKLLNDIQLEFRDKYKEDLSQGVIRNYEFAEEFNRLLRDAESNSKVEASKPKQMRTFGESKKSQKTVASMIVKGNETIGKKQNGKEKSNEQKEAKEGIEDSIESCNAKHQVCKNIVLIGEYLLQ